MIYIESILLADDHTIILNAIRSILEKEFKVKEICLHTDTLKVAMEICRKQYSLYILDLEFEGMKGFKLIQTIQKKQPEARIIICTMHEELWHIDRMLEMNPDGIVLKKTCDRYIAPAVQAVMAGEKYLCPRLKTLQLRYKKDRDRIKTRKKHITPREQTVLEGIVQGKSSLDIAERMFVTEDAVNQHRKNLLRKLDAGNSSNLSAKAVSYGLVRLDEENTEKFK